MTIRKVAFIGAGNMGAPMARRVRAAGYEVLICDRDPAVLAAFEAEGVAVTTAAADCAGADAVIVLLANDAQIMDTMTGAATDAGGLAGAIPAGHHPLICMMGTTLPQTLHAIRDPLVSAGARLIDAPVSGGIVGAEQGTLTIMLGGAPDDIAAATPLMQVMGSNLFPCGPLGAGEVVKIINNMICITNMFLTAEAVELAQAHGVTLEHLSPILSVSTGLNFLTADAAIGRAQYGAWARTPAAYAAIQRVAVKDLHLALAMTGDAGLRPGVLQAVSGYVDQDDPQAMGRWMQAGGVAAPDDAAR